MKTKLIRGFVIGFLTASTLFYGINSYDRYIGERECALAHDVYSCEYMPVYTPVAVKAILEGLK